MAYTVYAFRFGSSRLLNSHDIHVQSHDIHVLRRAFWEGACTKMLKKGNVFVALYLPQYRVKCFDLLRHIVVDKCENDLPDSDPVLTWIQ